MELWRGRITFHALGRQWLAERRDVAEEARVIGPFLPLSTAAATVVGGGMGAILGSWVATLAVRWPHRLSASHGRSRCDDCGVVLRPMHLVPLLSWAALGGRCRVCRARIDAAHPLIEATGALAGAGALAIAPGAAGLAGLGFALALILLAVLDARHFWLPDRVTLPLAIAGLTAGGVGIAPPPADRLAGLVVGWSALAAIRALYRLARGREGMGAGDPKLMAAIGAWLGWAALPFVLLGASGLGLIAAVVAAGRGGRVTRATALPLGTLLAIAAMAAWALQQRGVVPLGLG